MNRGGPCRVAAKASSAALPSCLPAAASCCQLLGSQLAYPGVAGRGGRQEHRYCALGDLGRGPHLQRQLLLQHSRLRHQLLGSAEFKPPLYCPPKTRQDGQQPVVPLHLAPPGQHPDKCNGTLGLRPALRSDKSPAGTRRLFLHPEHIFHSPRVNQHSRASGDHGEHLNTKLTTTMLLLRDAC